MNATDELWAWVVTEPDGSLGLVATKFGGGEFTPLVFATERVALKMRPLAQAHADASGKPVRLLRYTNPVVVEEL